MIEATVELDGKPYPICFTTHSQYALDVHCRRERLGSATAIIDNTMAGRAGVMEIVLMLWALMEGGRKRNKTRLLPYSVDEVTDLMDKQPGGILGMVDHIIDALKLAQPKNESTTTTTENTGDSSSGEAKVPPEKND
jgi:hypothetical protein